MKKMVYEPKTNDGNMEMNNGSIENTLRRDQLSHDECEAERPDPEPQNHHHLQQNTQSSEYLRCDKCGLTFTSQDALSRHSVLHSACRPFVCDQCGWRFKQYGVLLNHKARHMKHKPYKCDECGLSFPLKKRLAEHKIKHMIIKRHTCSECGKSFQRPCKLQTHLLKHLKICEGGEQDQKRARNGGEKIVKKLHVSRTQLWAERNQQYVHGKGFECSRCGRSFKKKRRLLVHSCAVCEERAGRHRCEEDECGRSFSTAAELRRHQQFHGEAGDRAPKRCFKCDECDRSFVSEKRLTTHKHRLHLEKSFPCSNGVEETVNERLFRLHPTLDKNNHGGQREDHSHHCTEALEQHEKFHPEEPSNDQNTNIKTDTVYICDLCGDGLTSLLELQHHQLTNICLQALQKIQTQEEECQSGETVDRGNQCGNSGSKPELYKHPCVKDMKSQLSFQQDGETKDKLEQCGKSFGSDPKLLKHQCSKYLKMKPHSTEHEQAQNFNKTDSGDQCGQTFASKFQLNRQSPTSAVISYTSENSGHRCDQCGRIFKLRKRLTDHLLSHMDHKPHTCSECGRGFIRPSLLLKHRQRFHEAWGAGQRAAQCEKIRQSAKRRWFMCRECGVQLSLGCTDLTNVFSITDFAHIKCFIENHTLI